MKTLLSRPEMPLDRRIVYALELLAEVRTGEAAALRWRHYDPTKQPLGELDSSKHIPVHPTLAAMLRLANARRPGEKNRTASQPVRDLSPSCAAGDITACHCVANGCNGPLQVVAPAEPVTEALDRARAAWFSNHGGRRLRRDLLALLAELEDRTR